MRSRRKFYMLFIGFSVFFMLSMTATAMYADSNFTETDRENVITESDTGGGDITGKDIGLIFILGGAAFLVFFFIILAL